MSEKLQFSIGVDLSDLDKGLNDAGKEIKKFTDANKREFERAGIAIAGLGVSIVAFARDAGAAKIEIVRVWEEMTNAIANGDILTTIGAITTGLGIFIGLIPTLVSVIAGLRAGFAALNLTMAANPIGAILAAIGLVIGGVVLAMNLFSNSVEKLSVKTQILTEINKEAVKGMAKEKAELVGLVAVARDETMSKDQRLKAVKKLNEISPEYLGNITLETINTEGATKAIDAYNNALTRKAQAQAAQSFLQKVIEKQMTFELDYQKATIGLFDKVLKAQDNLTKGKGNYQEELARVNRVEKEARAIRDAGLASTKAEYDAVMQLLRGYGGLNIELKKTKELKEQINTPQVSAVNLPNPADFIPQTGAAITSDLSMLFTPEADTSMQDTLLALEDFDTAAGDIINNSIANTFAGLAAIIGDAFSGGGNAIEKFGSFLLGSMGQVLVDLGKLAIQTGVGLLGVKTALKTLNPAVAIAAGAALVAIGSAFSKGASNIANSSGGGGVGNARGSSTSNVATSSFASFSAQSGNEVVFRIAGSDLLGVLRRAEGNELRLG
jgi:hypothetical protein